MKKEKVCKENYVCFKAILLLSLLIFSLNTCKWITYHNFTRFPITAWYRWHRVKFYQYQHLRLAWSVKMSVFGNSSWIYCTLLLFWLKKIACVNRFHCDDLFHSHQDTADVYGEVQEEGDADEDNEGEEAAFDATLHANVSIHMLFMALCVCIYQNVYASCVQILTKSFLLK